MSFLPQNKCLMMNKNKIKKQISALASMGMTAVVLGVILLTTSFAFNIKNNILLFAGLIFVIVGTIGYVYSLKQKPE